MVFSCARDPLAARARSEATVISYSDPRAVAAEISVPMFIRQISPAHTAVLPHDREFRSSTTRLTESTHAEKRA
jgi:hypothetical protein